MGKIYLLESNIDGYITYKIGKTKRRLKERLKELSTGNAGDLNVIYEFESDYSDVLEKSLHRHFLPYNIKGEWFNDSLTKEKFVEACTIFNNALFIINKKEH